MKLVVSLMLLFGVGASSTIAGMSQGCLAYESGTVTLQGRIIRKIFAGPPNYESTKKGDERETYWILRLNKVICVKEDESRSGTSETEKNVSQLQLVLDAEQYARYKNLRGKRVEVSGKLFHSHTGHHRTNVLLEVTEMKAAQ